MADHVLLTMVVEKQGVGYSGHSLVNLRRTGKWVYSTMRCLL